MATISFRAITLAKAKCRCLKINLGGPWFQEKRSRHEGVGAPGQREVPFPEGIPLAKGRTVPYIKKDHLQKS